MSSTASIRISAIALVKGNIAYSFRNEKDESVEVHADSALMHKESREWGYHHKEPRFFTSIWWNGWDLKSFCFFSGRKEKSVILENVVAYFEFQYREGESGKSEMDLCIDAVNFLIDKHIPELIFAYEATWKETQQPRYWLKRYIPGCFSKKRKNNRRND